MTSTITPRVGTGVRSRVQFYDYDDIPSDPTTVICEVTNPDGITTPYSAPDVVDLPGNGLFELEFVVDMPGRWLVQWEGSGSVIAIICKGFFVKEACS